MMVLQDKMMKQLKTTLGDKRGKNDQVAYFGDKINI